MKVRIDDTSAGILTKQFTHTILRANFPIINFAFLNEFCCEVE